MIDVREIRIGNWFRDPFFEEYNMTEFFRVDFVEPFDSGWKEYEPVIITEEILLKAGFVKIKDKNRLRDWFEIKIKNTIYRMKIGDFPKDNPNCGYIGVYIPEQDIPYPKEDDLGNMYHQEETWQGIAYNIKYLHRLQNIIHSLTETELNIEL